MNIVNDLFLHIWVLDPDSEDVIYTIQTRSGNTIENGEKGDTRAQRVAKRDLGGGIIFKIIFAKTHPEIMHPILIIRLLHYRQSSYPPT